MLQSYSFCTDSAASRRLLVGGAAILLILWQSPLVCQTPLIDSLTAIMLKYEAQGKADTVLGNLYNRLSAELARSNTERSLLYARKGEKLAERLQHKELLALSSLNIGIVMWRQGKLAEALEADTKALGLFRSIGDKQGMAKALNNIGTIYDTRRQPDLAIQYYKDALVIAEEIQDKRTQAFLLTNLGSLNTDKGHYEVAVQYHKRGLALKEELGDTLRLWSSVIGLAAAYQYLKHYEEALAYYRRGTALAMRIGDKEGEAMILGNMAELYLDIGEKLEARDAAMNALKIAREEQLLVMQETILKTLSLIAEKSGNIASALDYYKQYSAARDSLFRQENNDKLAKLHTEYETAKKEQQIQILEQSQRIDQLWRNGLIGGIILLSGMVLLLFNRYSIKRRSEEALAEKNTSLQRANTEILRQQDILSEQARNIQLANTQLHETIAQLQRTNHELEEANLAKMKFVHLATHDLKNFLADLQHTVASLSAGNSEASSNHPLATLLQSTQSMHAVMLDVLQTNAQLEHENEIKIKLLSIVAHDLRNPLTSILGVSRLLLGGGLEKPNAGELVQMIISASDSMYRLINDLLDNTALQLGKLELHFQHVNLAELCHDVVEQYRAPATKKHQSIRVSLGAGCVIEGDWKRMQQVVENLVSNAVKYSPFDAEINVRLFVNGQNAHLEVADEGPGLTDDDKQKLFGFFQRLSAKPTGGEPSSGVGLSSAKKIVELHGGHIRAESTAGDGATFIVELPLAHVGDTSSHN